MPKTSEDGMSEAVRCLSKTLEILSKLTKTNGNGSSEAWATPVQCEFLESGKLVAAN